MYIRTGMSSRGKFRFVSESPIGPIGVCISRECVQGVEFLDRRSKPFGSTDPLAMEAQRQLQLYFINGSVDFSLPLEIIGTDFQKRVWQALTRIGTGSVRTYGDIASELNTSPRAVGNACRSNPVPLIIPCHRVVSANGIGGFAGATRGRRLQIKRWLLQHEGVCL